MLDTLSGETMLYPILGDPIAFVQSPRVFSAGLASRGINAVCIPMRVSAADFAVVMPALSRTPNVTGLLIAMPHKVSAYRYCASSDTPSSLLGGVSVMRRNADDSWHGGMLDGMAFVKAQIDRGARPKGARVLLIGAGAAGSAIAIALLEAGVRDLVVHDADPSRVAHLLTRLDDMGRGRIRAGSSDPTDCDMVCHATPMGLNEGDALPLDVHLLKPAMFVGDVIAGHGKTPLIQAAERTGCGTATGAQMVDAVQTMMLDFMGA